MERHKCRLCLKSFPNGRALGGHMRSHMFNLPVVPRAENPEPGPPVQLCEETDSASSSEEEEGEEGEGTELQGYGLRENPKRSIRLVDPEFSFPAVDAASVVLQDRESETESSRNPTRRRSKRIRKPEHHQHHDHNQRQEQENGRKFLKLDSNQPSKTESWPEPEPASSISNATTEEDVAFCLMLLSKDQWKKKDKEFQEFEETQNYSVDETDNDSEDLKQSKNRSRGRYKCDTCNKVFKSYQALGGHRASHKKMRIHSPTQPLKVDPENVGTSDKKIHECPVCFRVFSTGQALGGHKRSHVIVGAVEPRVPRSSTTLGDSLIDLNLPAAAEEDDFSQIELSAVSDAEFVNQTRR